MAHLSVSASRIAAFLLAAVLAALAPAAFAAITVFNVAITGSQQVPPNGAAGGGSGTATVDTTANTIAYSFTVTGLTGPILAAHFHGPAARSAASSTASRSP